MAVTTLRKPKVTIGGLIDQMSDLRDARRKIAAQDKELSEQSSALEEQLLTLMDAEGQTKATGHKAGAGIKVETQFSFDGEDGFDLFMPFMAKHKLWHLVQRRLSAPGLRELFEKKGAVPGIKPFVKRSISLRDL